MLYEHSLRIPMVVKGPGVPQGVRLPIMGTNVDDAPTWLALADIDTPATMDGRQLASAIVTNTSDPTLPAATRRFLKRNPPPPLPSVRKEQFVQYYSQGETRWRGGLALESCIVDMLPPSPAGFDHRTLAAQRPQGRAQSHPG